MKIKTFKDYWETKSLITLREYIKKYGKTSPLEQRILQKPYDEWSWDHISINIKEISLNFIKEFYEYVNWGLVSERYDLNEKFIIEFEQKINFNKINYNNLSIYFIRRYKHLLDWNKLSKEDKLSEDFYEEFQNYINWDIISNRYLSENFIRKFPNKVNWDFISTRNDLSTHFLLDFHDKFNYNILHITSFTFLMNCKFYVNKIQKWYKLILLDRKKQILLDKVMKTSKKNLLIKSISNYNNFSPKNKHLCLKTLGYFSLSIVILYTYYN